MSHWVDRLFKDSLESDGMGSPATASSVQEDADNTFHGKNFAGSLVRHANGVYILYIYRKWKGKIINLDRSAASFVLDKAIDFFSQFPASLDNAFAKRTEEGNGAYVLFRNYRNYGYGFRNIIRDFYKTV